MMKGLNQELSMTMTDDQRVTHARITDMPKGLFDAMPRVMVRVGGGAEVEAFEYFPDELSFTAAEFVGLTISECKALKHKKDVAYLRS